MNSDEVRRQWAERTGEYSPEYYAYYGPNETSESIREVLDRYVDRSAPVLELGCSSGRHLAHLHDHGFGDLSGVEVNDESFAVMVEHYPDMAARARIYLDAIEDVVRDFADDQFAAVYSVETLQHLHPDAEWVFAELARITDDLVLTVENEPDGGGDGDERSHDGTRRGDATGRNDETRDGRPRAAAPEVSYVNDEFPLYHRDWNRVFTDLGLREVESWSTDRDTIRVFRSPDG